MHTTKINENLLKSKLPFPKKFWLLFIMFLASYRCCGCRPTHRCQCCSPKGCNRSALDRAMPPDAEPSASVASYHSPQHQQAAAEAKQFIGDSLLCLIVIHQARLPFVRFGVQTPARAEIWFEISAPPAPPSQLGYDEYTDRTLSVGR